MTFLYSLFLAVVPILIAMDILGLLPIYISLVSECEQQQKKKILRDSIFTAAILSIGFIFAGKGLLVLLGVGIPDFQIAGGLILLIMAILDLLVEEKSRRKPGNSPGIFPIGIPLLVGPAVLTAELIILDNYGYLITFLSVITSLTVAYLCMYLSDYIIRFIGINGSKVLSKVASLLLASIGVMYIRLGIMSFLKS